MEFSVWHMMHMSPSWYGVVRVRVDRGSSLLHCQPTRNGLFRETFSQDLYPFPHLSIVFVHQLPTGQLPSELYHVDGSEI